MTTGQQLASRLRAEVAAITAVLRILEAEQQALSERDPGQIEQCAAAKDGALRRLAALQQERQSIFEPIAPAASLGDLLRRLDSRAETEPLQQQLLHLGERCEALNAANGALIERLQQHTRSALKILRGRDTSPDLYSGSGETTHLDDRHSLGRA